MTPTIEDVITLDVRVATVAGAEPNTGAWDPGVPAVAASRIAARCIGSRIAEGLR